MRREDEYLEKLLENKHDGSIAQCLGRSMAEELKSESSVISR